MYLLSKRRLTHPHDPYEEGCVANEQEADGEVVEQGLWKPRLEEERTSQLGQCLGPGLDVVLRNALSENEKYSSEKSELWCKESEKHMLRIHHHNQEEQAS